MRRGILSVIVVALLLPACRSVFGERGGEDSEGAVVVVDNRNWLDMNVYVLDGLQRVRLGRVTGLSTESFELPGYLLRGSATLRFVVDPVGRQAEPITEEISVFPGDEVVLTIPPG